jgi:hypothetical protein
MRVNAERIDELVRELDSIADARIQSVARELIQSVTELHANALERILEILAESEDAGPQVIDRLGEDQLVGPLMALHGLHPLGLPERVARAVDKFGAEAEIVGIEAGHVQIRLRSQPHGCGATVDSKTALEDAIYNAAPDLNTLSIEEESIAPSGFVPLEALVIGSTR